MSKIDLTGQKFSRLTIIRFLYSKKGKRYWECKCDCGRIEITNTDSLRSGKTKSCGCYAKERARDANIKHNQNGTRIYATYANMKQRCYYKKKSNYTNYGGRGIKLCNEWLGKDGFINFYNWAMANGYNDTLTIERIDVNGNYSPENCKWIPKDEQTKNKTNNIVIEIDGEKKILAEWCKELNLRYGFVHSRIQSGWDVKDALMKPKEKTGLFEYKGQKLTIKELSNICGLSPKTIKSRLDRKWSITRIINQPYKARIYKEII